MLLVTNISIILHSFKMSFVKIAQIVLIGGFFILLAGKYFNLFPDYKLTSTFSLYQIRHIIIGLYVLLKIYDYKNSKNE